MYVDAGQEVQKAYIAEFMSDPVNAGTGAAINKVYKITNDRRVTAVGKIPRRTSPDELPQCLNRLIEQVSLVGPRPSIPYEFNDYRWRRRRLLAVKPSITGL